MPRFQRRRFGRRFFRRRRKKTEWIQGADFRFGVPLEMVSVFDVAGNPLCKTLSVILAGSDADLDAFQSGFRLERVVGDLNVFAFDANDNQVGAEVRLSIQRQRVYANVALGATGPLSDDPALHSSLMSGDDLGDEEIYWTRRFLTPITEGTVTGAEIVSAKTDGAIANIYEQLITGQNVQKLSQGLPFIDAHIRHRVHTDSRIFLYFDVVDAFGAPFTGSPDITINLRVQGYLRILITPL